MSMFNINSNQGNTKQNTMRYPFIPTRMDIKNTDRQIITSNGEEIQKLEFYTLLMRMEMVQALTKHSGSSSKVLTVTI